MFVEIDEIAIDSALLRRVRKGDAEAKAEARKIFNGMVLYMHALTIDADSVDVITIREACELGIVPAVTLGAEGFG